MSRPFGRNAHPLPEAPDEYNYNDQYILRRQLEQNFENLYNSIVETLTQRKVDTLYEDTEIGSLYDFILVDATTGNIVILLPPASQHKYEFSVKKIDSSANTVTILGNNSEEVDGSSSGAVISSQYDCVTVVSDLSAWWIR